MVLNGCPQITSHVNPYALHTQEHMKNYFVMFSRVCILTYSEFLLNLTTAKLGGLVLFIRWDSESTWSGINSIINSISLLKNIIISVFLFFRVSWSSYKCNTFNSKYGRLLCNKSHFPSLQLRKDNTLRKHDIVRTTKGSFGSRSLHVGYEALVVCHFDREGKHLSVRSSRC